MKFLRYKFTIIGALGISVLSLIPGNQLPETELEFADLVVHVLMYGVWSFCLAFELNKQYALEKERYLIGMIFLIGASYGGLIELVQHFFIPGRYGDLKDFFANSFGSALALMIFRYKKSSFH